jgi:ribokinase
VGSANIDLVARVARIPGPGETLLATAYQTNPGGKGRNQAAAAARAGATVAFIGAVGRDAFGEVLGESLAADDVDVTGLVTVDGPTGRALINVADDGENAIVVVAGANAALHGDHVSAHAGLIEQAGVVLAQLEVADAVVAHAFTLARNAGVTTMLNAAPAKPVPDLLALTDVLVVNEHEAALLADADVDDGASAEKAARSLLSTGPMTVVVTLGADGAVAVNAEGVLREPGFPVEVVDTTGAGDATCGALAAALADGHPFAVALTTACAAGAVTATGLGAIPDALRRDAIERLVSAAG